MAKKIDWFWLGSMVLLALVILTYDGCGTYH